MEEKVQEDLLDARLRDEAAYIDDAGFTSTIVQKLPARRVRRSHRAAILIGIAFAACVAAYLLSGGPWFIAEGVTTFAMMPLNTIWLSAGIATVLVMAGGLALALSKTRSRLR
jgi:fatty acid desaturase